MGFSPCPNDTFIFDALANNKIDTKGLHFRIMLADVQTLNQQAINKDLDITKISYGVLPLVKDCYHLLNSGSALGTGVGPLLIASQELNIEEIDDCIIAIPGKDTTAHLLFALAFPKANNKIFIPYDQIEDYVINSASTKVAGVIIHENRFTYSERGLFKVLDLGEFWQEKTGGAIPLGGIVGKKVLGSSILNDVNSLIAESVKYALEQYPYISEYVKMNAREMEESVMRKHIDLYVNKYTLNLGEDGMKAVTTLLDVYESIHSK